MEWCEGCESYRDEDGNCWCNFEEEYDPSYEDEYDYDDED